jgi:hypothetical protein
MMFVRNELPSSCKFELWDTLLYGTAGYAEEMLAVRLGETAIAFRDVGSNGQRCAVHLVGQMVVSGWKLFSQVTNLVSEVYRLLIDQKFLKGECHLVSPRLEMLALPRKRVVSRK